MELREIMAAFAAATGVTSVEPDGAGAFHLDIDGKGRTLSVYRIKDTFKAFPRCGLTRNR